MKVLCVFGTRPEAIKLAPVIRALRETPGIVCRICFSGQHREMGLKALGAFDLKPDVVLDTMQPGQSLASLTARLLTSLDALYEQERPDWIIVQGDTTTAMTGALAAFYRRIRIAHVEAGLRTLDRFSPFPEEINRVFISRITDLHFPPTAEAAENLRKEGISDDINIVTGNTVVDAVLWMKGRLPKEPPEGFDAELMDGGRLILVTCHRRESFGKPMENICDALLALIERFDDIQILFPVHPNPVVKQLVLAKLGGQKRISLVEPLDYLPLLWCMNKAVLILTDSGGIQEEGPSFGRPILILRTTTERPEAVTAGCAELVGTDIQTIVERASVYLLNEEICRDLAGRPSPFGDGRAGEAISRALCHASKVLDDDRCAK
ncbi:MAG: UDP-N-acetylglucosamine 2-epimerase (non-hydrolyzing) [Verrucomicrobia bacterium]|nr:UDP-N-acetylglucosamine 2-epimerase (non-hydrolyzing) [Verrucomicrobiota bacterium]